MGVRRHAIQVLRSNNLVNILCHTYTDIGTYISANDTANETPPNSMSMPPNHSFHP